MRSYASVEAASISRRELEVPRCNLTIWLNGSNVCANEYNVDERGRWRTQLEKEHYREEADDRGEAPKRLHGLIAGSGERLDQSDSRNRAAQRPQHRGAPHLISHRQARELHFYEVEIVLQRKGRRVSDRLGATIAFLRSASARIKHLVNSTSRRCPQTCGPRPRVQCHIHPVPTPSVSIMAAPPHTAAHAISVSTAANTGRMRRRAVPRRVCPIFAEALEAPPSRRSSLVGITAGRAMIISASV